MEKSILAKDIIEFLGNKVIEVIGDIDNIYIQHLRPIETTDELTLDWVNPANANKQKVAENSNARCIVCDKEVEYTDILRDQYKVLIYVDNPKRIICEVAYEYFVEKRVPCIHPSAIIDPYAIIGNNAYIGEFCVIGNCVIGDNTIVESHCKIYDGVKIGSNCSIKPGTVLGGEGFGFENDENGNPFRFPQIGGLIIGNYVEIGANVCIDRGALSDTVIEDHVKINNLCHIAHNNKIGSKTKITALVNISGSSVIGKDVWVAPGSTIMGWKQIGDNVMIGLGSVVTKDIPDGETWYGSPAKKIR